MYGLTRGLLTLASVGAAGVLVWSAGGFDAATTGGYWTAEALFIVSGVALALGQLAGRPRFSRAVFVFGFLPALIVGGWVLAAGAPHHGWLERHTRTWSADIGVLSGVDRLAHYAPLAALVVGLVFAFSFEGMARSRQARTLDTLSADATPESGDDSVEAEQGPTADAGETPTPVASEAISS